jgi:hypothetical protein
MPQLNLHFHDIPIPETHLWQQFDDEQRRAVIEILSRLLVKATRNQQRELAASLRKENGLTYFWEESVARMRRTEVRPT